MKIQRISAHTVINIGDQQNLGLRATWDGSSPDYVQVYNHLNGGVSAKLDELIDMLAQLKEAIKQHG